MLREVRVENGVVRGLPAADPRITSFKGIPFAAPRLVLIVGGHHNLQKIGTAFWKLLNSHRSPCRPGRE